MPATSEPFCTGQLADARDRHSLALTRHGKAVIAAGAGDVLVTGAALIEGADAACTVGE